MRSLSLSLVALFLVIAAGCGKEDKQKQNNPTTTPPITSMDEVVNTRDRNSLVGRRVEIADAMVQNVVGNYIFWAGDQHSAVPVARKDKHDGRETRHVRSGNRVRLSGTIRLVETVGATDWMWDKINEKERKDIEAAGVYILADDVMIVQ